MDLNFCVDNAILSRTDQEILVNKSKNYLTCNFQFNTNEWDGLVKFALFKDEENESHPVYLGNGDTCSCNVPSSVLNGDYFKVSVYGGDLISTNEKTVVTLRSGYNALVGDEKDILVEIFEKIEEKIDNIIIEGDELKFYGGEVLLGSVEVAPAEHQHTISDITGFEDNVSVEIKKSYRLLANSIRNYGG